MPVIWKNAPQDPLRVFPTVEEASRFAREKGYAVVPDWGWVLAVTDEQLAGLKELLK